MRAAEDAVLDEWRGAAVVGSKHPRVPAELWLRHQSNNVASEAVDRWRNATCSRFLPPPRGDRRARRGVEHGVHIRLDGGLEAQGLRGRRRDAADVRDALARRTTRVRSRSPGFSSSRPFSHPPALGRTYTNLTAAPLSSFPPRSDALELSDAFGLAHVSGVSSSKRSRMEDQMFGKMGALTLTLDISNGASSSGAVARRSAREDREARRARGQKRAGVTYRNGVAHVRLDLGATGATGATSVWDQIRARVDATEPWSLELRRATADSVRGLHDPGRDTTVSLGASFPSSTSAYARRLTSLSLRSGRGVGDEGAKILAGALVDAVPCLRFLDLSGNDLGRAGAEALAEALLVSSSRSGLSASSSYPAGVAAAFAASAPVSAAAPCALEELDLSANRVGSDGARALAAALSRRGCPKLRRLDLSQNVVGAEGAAAAAEILLSQARAASGSYSSGWWSSSSFSSSSSSSFKAHALEELDLRHNGCGDAGAVAIANALRESAAESLRRAKESSAVAPASLLDDARYEPRALKALRLGFNGVTEIGARALADAVIAVREAAREALGAEAARDACVVRELDLACNAVGAAGARAIGAALDSGVEDIDLGNNALGDEGAKFVAKALKENATTRKVCLAGNDIGAEGAWWIADAMCVNADVRWLDLGSNRVGDRGAEDIAEELKTNAGVQFLDLRRNGIGAQGAVALAEAAEANEGVTGVCLRGNRVDAGCQASVRARVGLRVDVEMQLVQVGGIAGRGW